MASQKRGGFSFLGTSLHAAFSFLVRAELDQHYYHEQLQTIFNSLMFYRKITVFDALTPKEVSTIA
jgi:hypothetical protein